MDWSLKEVKTSISPNPCGSHTRACHLSFTCWLGGGEQEARGCVSGKGSAEHVRCHLLSFTTPSPPVLGFQCLPQLSVSARHLRGKSKARTKGFYYFKICIYEYKVFFSPLSLFVFTFTFLLIFDLQTCTSLVLESIPGLYMDREGGWQSAKELRAEGSRPTRVLSRWCLKGRHRLLLYDAPVGTSKHVLSGGKGSAGREGRR